MYTIAIFLPLFGSIFTGFGGRLLGSRGAAYLPTIFMLITFLLSLGIFYDVGLQNNACSYKISTWVNSELFLISWGFLFDSLTVTMLIVVTFISTLVHLYSTSYMEEDPHLPRFMSYLSLFTFFMLILITSDNLVQMFVGWEGVGLCSYLLINFWFTRIQANKAAIKAMLMNRIGDFALALGIFSCFFIFNTLEYHSLFSLIPFFKNFDLNFLASNQSIIELIALLFFFGAVGKSAQLGLHTWLPDAMEGPTPVSALIHAATMVTAGVFLIARCSPLFEFAPTTLSVVTVVGAMTAFFAATTGLLQNDLKKVIAYSTCSQLGYMIFACGISNYSTGIFHLANHAFFKALLFLGAGSIIHALGDEQDMRKMGGLKNLLPFTYVMIFIGSLALMGFPYLAGFYSKDAILELAYAKFNTVGHFAYYLGSFAAFFTAFYSIRLIYLTFLTNPNGSRVVIMNAHESAWPMSLALGILAIPSIFIGYLFKDLFIGMGTDFWGFSIFIEPNNFQLVEAEFLDVNVKLFPLFLSLFGLFLAYYLYTFSQKSLYFVKMSFYGKLFYTFLNRKWYFDRIYNEYIAQFFLNSAYKFTYLTVDRGLIEVIGPTGIVETSEEISNKLSDIQSGYLYHYTFYILVSLLISLTFFLFPIKISLLILGIIIFNFIYIFQTYGIQSIAETNTVKKAN